MYSSVCMSSKYCTAIPNIVYCNTVMEKGRAIAQAVSRWLPTAAAGFETGFDQVGFVVIKVALGQVFSEYFGFPCVFIPQNSPSSQSPGAGTIGQKWLTCRVGPVWTPAPTIRIKKKVVMRNV
jgi:hypothetical protein